MNKRSDGKKGSRGPQTTERRTAFALCLLLVALVGIVFGQTIHDGFLNYDDNNYVYDSLFVTRGLSLNGVIWAFSQFHADNWHPLTTISHMLDCQLYGLQPWGHHLTNVLLHATASILLFLALLKLTVGEAVGFPRDANSVSNNQRRDSFWASAFVAALFAIHPLRVESVAWISERKDVLSGVFFALTLLAYAKYARADRRSVGKYILVLLFFALGLLCKPTLVTLPFVLLLLDYWPLQRMQSGKGKAGSGKSEGVAASTFQPLNLSTSFGRLVVEKLPLFVLSAISCVITILAQKAAFAAAEQLPFHIRFANAVVSYVIYLGQLFYPAHLAVLYPYPENRITLGEIIGALVLLWVITVAVILRKRYPFLLTGWFWFIGMLVPMIGLVQVGSQPRADRYTYLPTIGVFILCTWGVAEIIHRFHFNRKLVVAAAVLIIATLAARTYSQTEYWHDSETLWRHTVEITSNNHIARNSLGNALLDKGKLDEAILQYRQTLLIKPNLAPVESNLGNALLRQGHTEEAIQHFQRAIGIDHNYAEAYNDMGGGLMQTGNASEAARYYEKATQLNLAYADAENNLGAALLQSGQIDEAIAHYQKAVRIKPKSAEMQCNLGNAFARKQDWANAMAAYQSASRARPDYPKAHNNLGVALEAVGKPDEALEEFQKAIESNANYPEAHCNLGRLLGQRGRTEEAIGHLREALRLRPDYGEARLQLQKLGVAE